MLKGQITPVGAFLDQLNIQYYRPKVILVIFIEAVAELRVIPYSSFCSKFLAIKLTIFKLIKSYSFLFSAFSVNSVR